MYIPSPCFSFSWSTLYPQSKKATNAPVQVTVFS